MLQSFIIYIHQFYSFCSLFKQCSLLFSYGRFQIQFWRLIYYRKKRRRICYLLLQCGQNRQLNVPVVYLDNHKNIGNYRIVQNQRQNIPKAFQKIVPNFRRSNDQKPQIVHGIIGLKNLGNTCYFNTFIHCISHTQPLVDYFLSKAYKINSSCPTSGNITKAFVSLMEQIWDDENCFAESKDLKLLIQGQKTNLIINVQSQQNFQISCKSIANELHQEVIKFGDQEDCQELLSYLLDLINQELNRSSPNTKRATKHYTGDINPKWAADCWGEHLKLNRSIIVDLFQGQLKSTCCYKCQFQSHKFEPFLFLNLPIPKQIISIYECLKQFQEPEVLSGSCQWKCPECKINRDFEKSIQLWKLPNQLIINKLNLIIKLNFHQNQICQNIVFIRLFHVINYMQQHNMRVFHMVDIIWLYVKLKIIIGICIANNNN